MRNSTLFFSVLFLTSATVSAQTVDFKEMTTPTAKPGLTVRVVSDKEAPMRRAAGIDYGPEVSVLTQNFDGMTTGSIASPDMSTDLTLEDYEYPWWNMNPAFMGGQEHWGTSSSYSAGGCICLDAQGQGSHLSTPLLDLTGYDGIACIRFKARIRKTGTAQYLMVEAAETNNMGASWDYLGGSLCPAVTNQWQTFEFQVYGGGPTSMFNIVSYDELAIFIDDIEVYQIDQYVHTPVTLPYSQYTGTSFCANWQAVEGAESYLLDVYHYDLETGAAEPFLLQQSVTGNSYTVEGIVSGETYYYQVSAVKGEHVSMISSSEVVFDLVAPTNLRATLNQATSSFTAAWDAVPSADVYNYMAYYNHVAKSDGEFVVTATDFTGVVDSDGEETGWELESPMSYSYSQYYLPAKEMGGQAGWYGTAYAPYTDYICLDAWQYYYNHEDAALHSPELDFSKDGGRITVTLDAYGTWTEYTAEDGEWVSYHTVPAIALFNWNDSIGDYVQAELVYGEVTRGEWTSQSFTLTQGSKRTVLGVYALGAADNLYVDNLRITQQYAAGELLIDPFEIRHYFEDTQSEITVPASASDAQLYHQVSAVKSASGLGLKESAATYVSIEGTLGIRTPHLDLSQAARVTANDGRLTIQNPALAAVSVYSTDGKLLYRGQGSTIVTPVLSADFVIVKVGQQSIKVSM